MKTIIILFFLVLGCSIRKPQNIVEKISGLKIDSSAKVLLFEEKWNDFGGDGYSKIILELSKKNFDMVNHNFIIIDKTKIPIILSKYIKNNDTKVLLRRTQTNDEEINIYLLEDNYVLFLDYSKI